MQAEEAVRLGGQLVPEPVVDHGLCSLGHLLGGLEEKDHIARQLVPLLGQQTGRAVQPHGMEVVSAAVHQPVALGHGSVVLGLLLGDGVNVGPEGHRLTGAGPP